MRTQVTDLGNKPLSKAVIAKHCLTLGYVNMAEEKDVAMFWDFGSAVSSQQQSAGNHVKTAARSSGSKRARRPTKCLQSTTRSSRRTTRTILFLSKGMQQVVIFGGDSCRADVAVRFEFLSKRHAALATQQYQDARQRKSRV